MKKPETVVQAQVEAYNARDIDRFVACHDPQVQLHVFSHPNPYATGREQLRKIYQDIFDKSPDLHAEIKNRMVYGNTVIDHEIVTGRKGMQEVEIIAVYEVQDGLIAKAHFIRS